MGFSRVVELSLGHQSRVFVVELRGSRVAVKLTDRRFTDAALLENRMAVVEALSVECSEVLAPRRIAGELVAPAGGWLMTVSPFIDGARLEVSSPEHGHLMGGTLARLHLVLASLPAREVPPVAALTSTRYHGDGAGWQLLHGDYSHDNLIKSSSGLRIIDFDDCGYGPVEYDVANSLYMVMFDVEVNRRDRRRYEVFRTSFLDGYSEAIPVGMELVDEMIKTRIQALSIWLDDLSSAPIGIRTSSPEWQDKLRSFVRAQGC